MLAKVSSFVLHGIEAVPVTVECETAPGIGIHLVGLADSDVKESLLRTVTALQAAGYSIPGQKIVINIAPAVDDSCSAVGGLDLPIALALLAAGGVEDLPHLDEGVFAGELGLDGSLRSICGGYCAGVMLRGSGKKIVLPAGSARDSLAAVRSEGTVFAAARLADAVSIAKGLPVPTAEMKVEAVGIIGGVTVWDTIRGMDAQKRALEIAAAGGHHILLIGPTGSPRWSLAMALRDALPPMTEEETGEVEMAYSSQGELVMHQRPSDMRPFRAPHYSCSLAAMAGGGARLQPGAMTLASGGVLYLDQYALVPNSARQMLRVGLENGKIALLRRKSTVMMPTRFQLVLGTDSCPCGHYGEGDICKCEKDRLEAFHSRLGGPVYDYVDIQAWVPSEAAGDNVPAGESLATVRQRVAAARERQMARQGKLNRSLGAREMDEHCSFTDDVRELLEKLFDRMGISARAYPHILKVARTIADLEGSDMITAAHVAEAASYRFLDRRSAE